MNIIFRKFVGEKKKSFDEWKVKEIIIDFFSHSRVNLYNRKKKFIYEKIENNDLTTLRIYVRCIFTICTVNGQHKNASLMSLSFDLFYCYYFFILFFYMREQALYEAYTSEFMVFISCSSKRRTGKWTW